MLCKFVFVKNCSNARCTAYCSRCGHSVLIKPGLTYKRNCRNNAKGVGSSGTHLARILSLFIQSPSKSCKCRARANHMNAMGNDWCEQNIETIVEWLKEEASARGLPFFSPVARMLVRRAIANARKEASRGKAEAT